LATEQQLRAVPERRGRQLAIRLPMAMFVLVVVPLLAGAAGIG